MYKLDYPDYISALDEGCEISKQYPLVIHYHMKKLQMNI